MKQLVFICSFILCVFTQAQQVNFNLAEVTFNPSNAPVYQSFTSFSVLDVQSNIPFAQRKLKFYGQYQSEEYKSTLGVSVNRNDFSALTTSDFKLVYAYKVDLDTATSLNLGLGTGMSLAKLSNTLIFEDQLSVFETQLKETKEELITGNQNSFFLDAGVSITKRAFSIGLSALNIVKPKWNFSLGEVASPTSINASLGYELNLNTTKTLALKPIVFSRLIQSQMNLGGNAKLTFSGYEGFEGKVYTGVEYVYGTSNQRVNSWQVYIGYTQNKLSFHYSLGQTIRYQKQFGTSNFLMVGYQF